MNIKLMPIIAGFCLSASVGAAPDNVVKQTHGLLDMRVLQTQGPKCRFVKEWVEKSREDWLCKVEFTNVPEGVTVKPGSRYVRVYGTISDLGDYPFEYKVTARHSNIEGLEFEYTGVREFRIVELDMPKVTFEGEIDQVSSGIFPVDVRTGKAGRFIGEAPLGDLSIKVTTPNGETINSNRRGFAKTRSVISNNVLLPNLSLWETATITAHAEYVYHPEKNDQVSADLIGVPSLRVNGSVEMPKEWLGSENVPITVNIGQKMSNGYLYDKESDGIWTATIGYFNEGTFVDVSPELGVDDITGSVTQAVNLPEDPTLKIAAKLKLQAPDPAYSREIYTRPAYITILKAGEIDTDVSTRRLSGPAPFISRVGVDIREKMDRDALGSVVWYTSTDGSSWEEATQYAGDLNFRHTFELGSTFFKAVVINSHDDTVYETSAVEFIGYNVPDIEILGPDVAFVGGSITKTAQVTYKGDPLDDPIIEWSLDGGETFTQSGPEVTLSSPDISAQRLAVRAKSKIAPDNDNYAWELKRTSAVFKKLKNPNIYIQGDKILENGESYLFTARIVPPYSGMDIEMNGEFTLPDGSVISGSEATYIADLSDTNEQGRIEIPYTAWVEGFRSLGVESTYIHKARAWEYEWPTFGLNLRYKTLQAPATIIANMRTVGRRSLDEPQYSWTLPFEAEVISDPDRYKEIRELKISTPGIYDIQVEVTDARGNSTTEVKTIEVLEPEPYNIGLEYSASNDLNREPLNVLVRPYITGGHPDNGIVSKKYYVNGTVLEGSSSYARATLDAGTHNVQLEVTTKFGDVITGDLDVVVADNEAPVCDIKESQTSSSVVLLADCDDSDGKIRSYKWTADGEELGFSSNKINFSKSSFNSKSIELVGVDDSGEHSDPVSTVIHGNQT